MTRYVASIGMEVHAELSTQSKMFCRCPVAFGGEPNTRVCPVCLGLPGALPVANRAAVEMVARTALALNCHISFNTMFERKNYFYPDLPKGYQISQYTHPIGYGGHLDIETEAGRKRIKIQRVHLEEDTGKLMHLPSGESAVDYNRSGVPLMEIVTDFPPDLESAEEAKEYLAQLRLILMYLGVCDGKMEEGSLRCEPNISVRPEGAETYGTKTELKNLGSFRSVLLGVEYEIARQIEGIERGERMHQETRGWDESREQSFLMRRKETENDYRYFPDPDLPPMRLDPAWIDGLKPSIPELPMQKWRRYTEELGLDRKHALTLVEDPAWAEYFDAAAKHGNAQQVCNWLLQDFTMHLKEDGISPYASKIEPSQLAELTVLIANGTISGKMAKEIFAEMYATGASPSGIVEAKGLKQITDREPIVAAARKVINEQRDAVERYRAGQVNVKGFLVGQVIKQTNGRANPSLVQEIMQQELDK